MDKIRTQVMQIWSVEVDQSVAKLTSNGHISGDLPCLSYKFDPDFIFIQDDSSSWV